MMNADRLFMLVDTCANIDEVKHEFPNLDFLPKCHHTFTEKYSTKTFSSHFIVIRFIS